MTTARRHHRRTRLGCLSRRQWLAALAVTLAPVLLIPVGAAAGEGSSGYEGTFSSSPPSGYNPAPGSNPVKSDVVYQFTVTNTGVAPAQLTGSMFAQRITRIGGVDVSSGRGGFSEDEVLHGATSGDPPAEAPLPASNSPGGDLILPGQSETITVNVGTVQCGYMLIWAGQSTDRSQAGAILNQGATRVVGCSAPASSAATPAAAPAAATPPATPRPAGSSRPAPTAAPTSSTPSTQHPTPEPTSQARPAGAVAAAAGPVADPTPTPTPAPLPSLIGSAELGPRPAGIGGTQAALAAAVVLVGAVVAVLVVLRQRRGPSVTGGASQAPPHRGTGAG